MFSVRIGGISLVFVFSMHAKITFAQQLNVSVLITNDLCSDCDIRNGLGYSSHPTYCNKYLQCFPTANGGWRAVARFCPPGLVWQQQQLTCNRPINMDCPRDPHYPDDDIPSPIPCPYEEHETDKSKYYVYVWGKKTMMSCPDGTAFTWNSCVCIITPGIGNGCRAELYLPFDTDLQDHARGNWVDNRGAYLLPVPGAVGGQAAYFNGNATVIVPRFTAQDFRQTVVIKVRYLEGDNRSRPQAVITNSDCNLVPSIAIAHDNEQPSTKGILRTGSVSEFTTQTGHARGIWKEVTYRYNGKSFVLTTNGKSDGGPATGNVRVVHSALHIGDGSGLANFKGYIDEVYVYLCNP